MHLLGFFEGPTDQTKPRFIGDISIVLNQPTTTKFFIFAYTQRIYEFDVVSKKIEERNLLSFNGPLQGGGYKIIEAFIIGNTYTAVGFGSFDSSDLNNGNNLGTYMIDLTKNDNTGIIEQVFTNFIFPHTTGTYLGILNGENYIALGSHSYSGKIYMAKKIDFQPNIVEYKMLKINTVAAWSPTIALTSDSQTYTVFAAT